MKGLDVQSVRKDFPILERKVNGHPLVYFDNAATAQKPRQVIDALVDYYSRYNANIHRGVHKLAEEATLAYEDSRKKVASLVNAKPDQSIFTRGTTESLNLVMYAYALPSLGSGDEIITTMMEHHSNIVPWFMLQKRLGIRVKFANITDDGLLDLAHLESLITGRTKIMAFSHVSNVLGTINPVKKLCSIARKAGAISVVDGAQAVPHMEVDVRDIGADFYCFSSHKMCGPTGVGLLVANKKLLEGMEGFHGGGEMISEVHASGFSYNEVPHKFEAGTPNIADAIVFGHAVDYLKKIGLSRIHSHTRGLAQYAAEQLSGIPKTKIYGPKDSENRSGLVSFNIGDIHPHDLATILDSQGVAIRSGHHCAQPLAENLGIAGSSRASFYLYNTQEEIDVMMKAIGHARKLFNL